MNLSLRMQLDVLYHFIFNSGGSVKPFKRFIRQYPYVYFILHWKYIVKHEINFRECGFGDPKFTRSFFKNLFICEKLESSFSQIDQISNI